GVSGGWRRKRRGPGALWPFGLSRSGTKARLLRFRRGRPYLALFISRLNGHGGAGATNWTRMERQMTESSFLSRIEKLCAEKGLRMTDQRRTIARVLSEADDHP